ncbi:hypothetical protein [Brachybacterium massiliense]|nr:hypothetical protein [Brachybacterium massiliense]
MISSVPSARSLARPSRIARTLAPLWRGQSSSSRITRTGARGR